MADQTGSPIRPSRSRGACAAGTGVAGCNGLWRCRVGWLVYLLVAVAVVAVFGAGVG
jgi:hypothetical protein